MSEAAPSYTQDEIDMARRLAKLPICPQWVLDLIETEQRRKSYGRVEVCLEGGTITRAKVERSEKAPVDK